MFERMEIAESIYESVVEPSYKKTTREDTNRAVHSRNKRGESASSKTLPTTGESDGKQLKIYLDLSKSESETCLSHGPEHSSDEYKIMGYFFANYTKINPTEDYGNHPIPRKTINRQLENNYIIKNVVDDILLNETQKLGAEREAPELLDSDCNDNNLYQVDKTSLEETKE